MIPLFAHIGILRRKPPHYAERIRQLVEEVEILAGRIQKGSGGLSLGDGNEAHSMQKRIDAASPAAQVQRHYISQIDPSAADIRQASEPHWWNSGAFE